MKDITILKERLALVEQELKILTEKVGELEVSKRELSDLKKENKA
jgi:hypothetical protein